AYARRVVKKNCRLHRDPQSCNPYSYAVDAVCGTSALSFANSSSSHSRSTGNAGRGLDCRRKRNVASFQISTDQPYSRVAHVLVQCTIFFEDEIRSLIVCLYRPQQTPGLRVAVVRKTGFLAIPKENGSAS